MKIKKLVKPVIKGIMYILRVIPIKENKVVFSAFSAHSYSDNPKYIAEEILREKLPLDCVFVLKDPDSCHVPLGIRKVKYNTLNYLYEMATAKVWIDNTRKQPHIIKRAHQKYIQTWHGAIALKKIEKDAEYALSAEYIHTAKNDSSNIDVLTTNSIFGKNMMRSCFWYNGKIEITGSARLDILTNTDIDIKETVRANLGIKNDEKVILYCPTFRRIDTTDVYDLDYAKLRDILKKKWPGNWRILLRLHPNMSSTMDVKLPYVSDVSKYPDINEIYTVSDVLITDYSSTMFDFSVIKRPIFIYAVDIDEYRKDRDTYFELRELPFPVAENNSELVDNIFSFNETDFQKNLKVFHESLSILEDGLASKRIAAMIKEFTLQRGR